MHVTVKPDGKEDAAEGFGLEFDGAATIPLLFSVRDTGIGIPVEKRRSIFESFRQVDGSTTRKYGGTGLGLTICKRLASMMGGRIWVVSEIGKGSEFLFTVHLEPATAGNVRPLEREWDSKRPHRIEPLNILLVEDDPVNAMLGESFFDSSGLHCDYRGQRERGCRSS